jgi:hypothetical protein
MHVMKATSIVVIACLTAAPSAGCATVHGPREADATQSGVTMTRNWSRIAELAPAAEISLSTTRLRQRPRNFVVVDDSRIIVLNLADPPVAAKPARALRDVASRHPEYFAALQTGRTFVQDDVRIGADGVFVAGSRIGDLDRVVESIRRDEVVEIQGPVAARGSVPGSVLGGWVGFAVGALPGLGGASPEVTWLLLSASVAVGAYLGFRWSRHETEGIVYRAR